MTFNPRPLWRTVAFIAVLALAINAREGNLYAGFAAAGVLAILAVEWLLIIAPAVSPRTNLRSLDRAKPPR